MFKDGSVILFTGDSVTDCGRDREEGVHSPLGAGYPCMLAGKLGADNPQKGWRFINRGIWGDRVTDLYARLKRDLINLSPDVLSVLVGINDVWHDFQRDDGVSPKRFDTVYRLLLDATLEALPKVSLIIMEPFVLNAGEIAENRAYWSEKLPPRREIIRKIAKDYGAIFVPLQEVFDKLSETADPARYALDGVHPTAAGHSVIAREWEKAVFNK
ncbi:MAG: SGNH/GDSL hydrolase family protein [Clostridiales bacterium]|jgi:lysophospholipase L1-like esterase|nr:SGNH/GDSL hydrolase family protein [Clostridiales bacterium]